MKDKSLIIGMVRLIECDGKKYPNFEDVDTAIKNGDAKISHWYKNIIPLTGHTALARRLCNIASKSNEGIITYGAVGTGDTTPTENDIKLVTDIKRKLVAQRYNTDNVATIRTFFATTDANGTLKEYGLFGEDATTTTDSGTLFERVIIDKVKTTAITLTIETEITIL